MTGPMIEGQERVLCVAASAAERVAAARRWLGQRDPARPLCIVTPTLTAGARLVHGLPPGTTSFGFQRFTLEGLVDALALRALARAELAPARAAGERALCARALEGLRAAGALGRLMPVADRPGLVEAAVETLRELRHAGLSPALLAARRPELAALLEAYERVATEAGLADAAQRRALATGVVEAGAHPLCGVPLLLLDVPLWLRSERRLLAALVARSRAVFAACPLGDGETQELLDGLDFAPAEPAPPPALGPFQRGLFSESQAPLPAEIGARVHWAACVGESRECVEVARHLRDRARAGTRFDAMAVVLRSPESYRAPLEEALDRAGVPAHFARGVRRPDPAGRALLVLLRCARDGLSARAFAEYLSLGQLPVEGGESSTSPASAPDALAGALAVYAEPGVEPSEEALLARARRGIRPSAVPRRFERWLVESAVVGGLSRWRRRLSGLLRAQEEALAEHDEEGPTRERLARQLDEVRALRELALPLIERLDALPARASWSVWLGALHALCDHALCEPGPVQAALAELAPLGAIEDVSLDEVLRVLEGQLGDAFRPSAGLGAGKVFVGGIEDVAGMEFELVCVPGLTEKVFPRKDLEDPLLLDRARGELEGVLPTRAARLARERLRLRLCVGAAREALWLSYPRVDSAQGKPRVPSLYALELLRLRDGELLGLDALLRRADKGGAARLGWPAPGDPEEAIDETEYDLAVLGQVLERPAAETRGEARYLVHTHPVLARALRFRARRWSRAWTTADGLMAADDDTRQALAPHRLAVRPYAATTLELFAACPYRFYLRAVVGLSPRPGLAPIETLDPAQRGSLFHAVQRELLAELRDAGLLPLDEQSLAQARARLDAAVARLAERAREEHAPAIEHVFDDAVAQLATDLRQWLEELAREPQWLPAHFELGFGLGAREGLDAHSQAEPVEVRGVRLRGAIDLVEQRRGGGAEGPSRLRATDHKTGDDVGRFRVVRGGRSLQPVLYALALEQLFPGAEVEGGRLYFCTSRGAFRSRGVSLDAQARRVAGEVLGAIDAALTTGFLPARPQAGACASCDYRPVCGPYEEERSARKPLDDPRLEGLYRIRSFK